MEIEENERKGNDGVQKRMGKLGEQETMFKKVEGDIQEIPWML